MQVHIQDVSIQYDQSKGHTAKNITSICICSYIQNTNANWRSAKKQLLLFTTEKATSDVTTPVRTKYRQAAIGYPPSQPSPHIKPQHAKRSLTERVMFYETGGETIRYTCDPNTNVTCCIRKCKFKNKPSRDECRIDLRGPPQHRKPNKNHNGPNK